jgi:hypothetical protein
MTLHQVSIVFQTKSRLTFSELVNGGGKKKVCNANLQQKQT